MLKAKQRGRTWVAIGASIDLSWLTGAKGCHDDSR